MSLGAGVTLLVEEVDEEQRREALVERDARIAALVQEVLPQGCPVLQPEWHGESLPSQDALSGEDRGGQSCHVASERCVMVQIPNFDILFSS